MLIGPNSKKKQSSISRREHQIRPVCPLRPLWNHENSTRSSEKMVEQWPFSAEDFHWQTYHKLHFQQYRQGTTSGNHEQQQGRHNVHSCSQFNQRNCCHLYFGWSLYGVDFDFTHQLSLEWCEGGTLETDWRKIFSEELRNAIDKILEPLEWFDIRWFEIVEAKSWQKVPGGGGVLYLLHHHPSRNMCFAEVILQDL